MGTLLQLQQRIRPLRSKEVVYGVLFEVIKRFEAYLIDFNLIQLEEGRNIRNELLGRYSRATEIESLLGEGPRPIQPKREGEPYNFQWTGGLFDGFTLIIENNTATFTSRDSKTPLLVEKHGDIFGLSPENLAEAIKDRIGPAFVQAIREKLLV